MIYHQKIFERLEQIAIESNEGWARLSAAVVRRSEIVSIGVNSKKSHPFQAKWGRNSESIFLHAETDAIKNAIKEIGLDQLEYCDLYVCRMKKDGPGILKYHHGLALPCDGCRRCIANFGIRNVFYTTNTHNEIEYL